MSLKLEKEDERLPRDSQKIEDLVYQAHYLVKPKPEREKPHKR